MKDYLFVFLRHAKNKPAAAIMMRHPAIVKIVVPIPPVDGREESVVFTILVVFFSLVQVPLLFDVNVDVLVLSIVTDQVANVPSAL